MAIIYNHQGLCPKCGRTPDDHDGWFRGELVCVNWDERKRQESERRRKEGENA